MSDTQEQNRKEAISKLRGLKFEFERAANLAGSDTSRWRRKYPASYDVENFNNFAELTQRTINSLVAEKEWREVYRSFGKLVENPLSWSWGIESHLKKRFSGTKHSDRKLLAQYQEFKQKADEIRPLLEKALTP